MTRVEQIEDRSETETRDGKTPSEHLRRIGECNNIGSRTAKYLLGTLWKTFSLSLDWTPHAKETLRNYLDGAEEPATGARAESSSRADDVHRSTRSGVSGPSSLRSRISRPDRLRRSTKNAIVSNGTDIWYLLSIAVIGAYVFVYTVGYHPFIRWDEAIYANVAWHMVETGDWLIPQLYFHPQQPGIELQPFLEKPPLVFWMQAISIKLFDATRFAIRLPVATLALLSGMLTYWFGKQLSDRKAGLVATTVIFTSPLIVIGSHGGRTGSTDVPLLFFGTLFVYLTWTTLTNRRSERLPLIGIAAGLALLSKGFNAGIFVIAVAPVALYYIRDFVTREGVTLVGVTAAIALPWPLYAWSRYGNEFIQQIFLTQVVGRATGSVFVTRSGTLFSFMRYPYFREFPTFFDPWVYLLFPALAAGLLYAWSQDELEKPLFLVWWAATTFGFFVMTGNHGWYIMPMLVPCALIIGYAGSAAAHQYKPAILALVGGGLLMLWNTGVTLETVAVVLGIVLIVLGGFSGSSINARLANSDPIVGYILPVMAVALLVGALVGGVPLEHEAPQYNPEERFGQAVANEVPEGSVVGIEPLGTNLWRASFYSQRPLTSAPPEDLQSDSSLTYAIVSNDTLSELDRDHRILAEWQNVRLVRFTESRTDVSKESNGRSTLSSPT